MIKKFLCAALVLSLSASANYYNDMTSWLITLDKKVEMTDEIRTKIANCFKEMATLVEQKNWGECFKVTDFLKQLLPSDPMVFLLCGALNYEIGRYNEAIIDFNTAIGIDKNFGSAYFMKACCYLKLRDKVRYIYYLEQAANLGSTDAKDELIMLKRCNYRIAGIDC